jgi:hypothetical protein
MARPIVEMHMSTPTHRSNEYPRDSNGFVRQCAWCRRVADHEGRYRIIATKLIHGASHGCCEACAIRFLGRVA